MSTPSPAESIERIRPARRQPAGVRSSSSFAIAIGLHLLVLLMVPEFRASIRDLAPTTSADLVEVEPEPAAPPPPAPAPPPPTPRERLPTEAPPEADAPPPLADQAEQALPEVLELDETLSNSGFSIAGTTNPNPTGAIQSGVVTGMNTQGTSIGTVDGTPGATGPVRDEDLSVRAAPPPNLDSILDRHYPPLAQQQGIEGVGVVNVEVRADGSIGRVTRRSETVAGYGFAQACIATIREGGAWVPARDQNGQAVTSTRPFRCTFDMNH